MKTECPNCDGYGFVSYEVHLSERGIPIREHVQPCHLCQGSWREWADKLIADNARRVRVLKR
jgi:hypothetical protein